MNAKRDYVPEDEKNFSPNAQKTLHTASRHISCLINEGYDLKQATTFVWNHFLLSERQRLAIIRSLATGEQLANRRRKELKWTDVAGRDVFIDGFNTFITLEVLLSGYILFTCMDGTIRDLAALRGTYRIIPETKEAVKLLFDVLQDIQIQTAHISLDEPVSNSGQLKTLLADAGEKYSFTLDIKILKDVDRALYEQENVITTDSVILDRCLSWLNLTQICMKRLGSKGLCVWE